MWHVAGGAPISQGSGIWGQLMPSPSLLISCPLGIRGQCYSLCHQTPGERALAAEVHWPHPHRKLAPAAGQHH